MRGGRTLARVALGLVALALLAWLLHDMPVAALAGALGRLSLLQVIAILVVNSLVVLVFSGRWWLILRAQGYRLPYPSLSAYRLAGFAVSYFTPGTQFGGEPLQVALAQRRHGVPAAVAAASVALDKALDLMGNATFLSFGIVLSLRLKVLPGEAGAPLAFVALGLLALPLAFLAAASRGIQPLSWALARLPAGLPRRLRFLERGRQGVAAIEAQVIAFCRAHPAALVAGMGCSLVSWVGVVAEFWMMTAFLDLGLSPTAVIGVITAARLALLLPLPGGVGALEASQVLAVTALGGTRAEGLSLGLLIRARDLAFGAAGLLLGWWLAR